MSQERVKGLIKEAKGRDKEDFGRAVGDRSTKWSDRLDQVTGSIQEKIGQAKPDTRRFADGLRVR